MIKIVKENIAFHYLLTEIQLYTLHGIKYIPQEVLNKIKVKSVTRRIFRIQDNGYIMFGFHCMAFKEYMLAGKTLLDYTNYLFTNDNKKNHKIIYKYFKDKYVRGSKS